VSKDYSEFLGLPKHFLFCQNTFCFHLLGLFIRIGEKLCQGCIQKSFLVIGDYKKIWNHTKIFFCAPSVLPPLFSQSSFFQLAKHLVMQYLAIIYVKPSLGKLGKNPQQKP